MQTEHRRRAGIRPSIDSRVQAQTIMALPVNFRIWLGQTVLLRISGATLAPAGQTAQARRYVRAQACLEGCNVIRTA
jgi:hypothetical protein